MNFPANFDSAFDRQRSECASLGLIIIAWEHISYVTATGVVVVAFGG